MKRLVALLEKAGCRDVVTYIQSGNAVFESPKSFREAAGNPKSVHLFFLARRPKSPDIESLNVVRKPSESFVLKGSVFYLHTPEGFGTSSSRRVPSVILEWRPQRATGAPSRRSPSWRRGPPKPATATWISSAPSPSGPSCSATG